MRRRVLLLLPLLFLAACSRHTVAQLRDEVAAGRYATAAETVEALYPGEDNELARTFELGLVRFSQGDLAGALDVWQKTDALVDVFRGEDWVNNLAKMGLNDTWSTYDGAAFEHIQVQYYRALAEVLLAQWQEGTWVPVPGATLPADGKVLAERYGRAIDFGRRLVIKEIGLTKGKADRRRYQDDPFGRVLLAALVAAADGPLTSDLQVANASLLTAARVYPEEASLLGADRFFRYEARPDNQVFSTLLHRMCRRYDPQGLEARAESLPPPRPVHIGPDPGPLAHPADLPEGWGSVLVLHHAGFVADPKPLTIGMITHKGPRWRRGKNVFSIGGLHFYADGPGAGICRGWMGLPIPGQLQKIIAPGGFSVIQFQMPVHAEDRPVAPPAILEVETAAGPRAVALEVVSDLDAYARAALKDHQPDVLVRTLFRTLVKQGAVAAGAAAVKRHGGKYKDAAALGVNLVGSLFMSATEEADLRCISLLPDRIEAVLVDLPAGSHRLRLETPGGVADLGEVTVKAGRLVIVPARSYR